MVDEGRFISINIFYYLILLVENVKFCPNWINPCPYTKLIYLILLTFFYFIVKMYVLTLNILMQTTIYIIYLIIILFLLQADNSPYSQSLFA